jgi:hypothetical protein
VSYSDIKSVPGKVKNTPGNIVTMSETDTIAPPTMAKVPSAETVSFSKITVGPNPNNGDCWFTVSGIQKEIMACLYTVDGKVIKQFHVMNLQQQRITGLQSGIYILKAEGLQPFRIVVQGSNNRINGYRVNNTSSIKD